MKDYYKILQIHPEASLEVMNTAYRTLVKQYHPDVYHSQRKTRMTEKMQEINEAYQVLSNTSTRTQYDQQYSPASQRNTSPNTPVKATLKRMMLWGLGSFVIGRLILSPLLSNPALKIFLVFALLFGLIRIYSKQKPSG